VTDVAGYIDVPFERSVDDMVDEALAFLAARYPNWTPQEPHLEVALVEELARLVHEGMTVAAQVPRAIFRYYGQSLLDLPPVDAAPATMTTTWTMVDAAGYVITAGTAVGFRVSADVVVPFVLAADLNVAPGTVVVADVVLVALEDGAQHNGYAAGPLEQVDQLAAVAAVESTAPSAGGVDAETDDEYLDRLADELTLWTPRPILGPDFAKLARRVAGVHRALGLDNYDPDLGTWDNERTVTVAIVDELGADLPQATKDAVSDYLEGFREVNFVVPVIGPTYTPVTVSWAASREDGYTDLDVLTRGEAAVEAYLSAATWAGGDESPPTWRDEPLVRYLEVATVLNNVAGLKHVTSLTINGGTVDVALAGPAGLPTVTVLGSIV
jgi:hypothetical protein